MASHELDPDELKPAQALVRLVYLAVLGCVVIIAFAARSSSSGELFRMASVGLMAGGAALLAGGLLGFLFGVPYTRGGNGAGISKTRDDSSAPNSDQPAAPRPKWVRDDDGALAYRPNTSLEQIIDWLTKIIVGVSLVEFRPILGKLKSAATFVGNVLDGSQQAYAFASTIFIYFGVSGFVFGFLWARLYLPQWFSEADKIRKLAKKVSQLEADATAFALAAQQAKLLSSAPPASDEEILKAVSAASPSAKTQLLGQMAAALNDKDTYKDQTKVDGVISVLRGLIKSEKEAAPENHFQLSRAWRQKRPSDFAAALHEVDTAIAIRDKRRIGGYTNYGFHRALNRVNLEGKSSDAKVSDDIVKDLRVVASDRARLEDSLTWATSVVAWMEKNKVTADELCRISGEAGDSGKST